MFNLLMRLSRRLLSEDAVNYNHFLQENAPDIKSTGFIEQI